MGQVSREMNPTPPSGRLRYNLGDYIRQRGLYEKGLKNIWEQRDIENCDCNSRISVNGISNQTQGTSYKPNSHVT